MKTLIDILKSQKLMMKDKNTPQTAEEVSFIQDLAPGYSYTYNKEKGFSILSKPWRKPAVKIIKWSTFNLCRRYGQSKKYKVTASFDEKGFLNYLINKAMYDENGDLL